MTEEEMRNSHAGFCAIFGNVLYQLYSDFKDDSMDAFTGRLDFFVLRIILQRIVNIYNMPGHKVIELVEGWLQILEESKELEKENKH